MAGETILNITGNLTSDLELRYTQSGIAVAGGTVASTPRTFDRTKNEWVDGEALFMRINIWRELGEHAAGSLAKGSRVMVTGRLEQRSYETKAGEKRTSMELTVDDIAPSLKYATATLTRASSGNGGSQGRSGGVSASGADSWATPAASPPIASQPDVWNQPGDDTDQIPF